MIFGDPACRDCRALTSGNCGQHGSVGVVNPPTSAMPATLELCARIRDGYPCLGRIHRSGVPEIVHCESCGAREAGVVYQRTERTGETTG